MSQTRSVPLFPILLFIALAAAIAVVRPWQRAERVPDAAAPAVEARGDTDSPVVAPMPAAEAPAATGAAADDAGDLCLTPPDGDAPLDARIRADQEWPRRLPKKADAWTRVGWGWVRKARLSGDPGFYVHAQGCADAALRIEPAGTGALELRGLALMNDHRFAEARDVSRQILEIDPRNAVALGALSDALLELGDFAAAVDAGQRRADVAPDGASHARASYFRWLTGDMAGAKGFIASALSSRDARDPEPTTWTFVEAAKIFWHEGDYDGADAVVDEALRWVPGYPAALLLKGRVALSRGRPQAAIDLLEAAYRAQPLPETAWLLADARATLGDDAGAREAEQQVVQSARRGDRLTLALFYATRDRAIDEAVRLIEEERASRGGIYVDDAYAWVLYRAGRLDEARRASDRAIGLGTPDARLLYHAGAIRIAAGDASGLALVERALALNPQFDRTGAAEARALLASRAPLPASGPATEAAKSGGAPDRPIEAVAPGTAARRG